MWYDEPPYGSIRMKFRPELMLLLSWFYFFNALMPIHDLSHDTYALYTWLISCPFLICFIIMHHHLLMILLDHQGYVIPLYAYTLTHHIYHPQSAYSMLFTTLPMLTPFSLIIISQLHWHLYYHHYTYNLGCASLMYLSSFKSIGDTNFKLVYPPDSQNSALLKRFQPFSCLCWKFPTALIRTFALKGLKLSL